MSLYALMDIARGVRVQRPKRIEVRQVGTLEVDDVTVCVVEETEDGRLVVRVGAGVSIETLEAE